MKKSKEILDLIKKEIADITDPTDLNQSIGWFSDQLNDLIISLNTYDKEKPKSVIILDDGESLKAHKGKVYRSHCRYQHGAIYTKENADYIYFNPEMSKKIDFEKPNQILLDLGYNLKEYVTLVTEELSPLNAQNLEARIEHTFNLSGKVTNFLGIVWHDPESKKIFPETQIKCSWVVKTRVSITEDFGHSINNGQTPKISLNDSIPMDQSFESHDFYLKLNDYELPNKNDPKTSNGIVIKTIKSDDKKITVFLKGNPKRNKEEIDHFNKIMEDYEKRNKEE